MLLLTRVAGVAGSEREALGGRGALSAEVTKRGPGWGGCQFPIIHPLPHA